MSLEGGARGGEDGLYVALQKGNIRLQPLAEHHREGLRAACAADAQIWAIYPHSFSGDAFDGQFDRMRAAAPQRRVYAVELCGEVVGMTGWLAHGAPGWSIEIGNTYLAPAQRGSGLNGEMKRLMLDHAFA